MGRICVAEGSVGSVVVCDITAHIGHCPLPADVGAPAQSLVPSGIEVQADRAVVLLLVGDVLLECET